MLSAIVDLIRRIVTYCLLIYGVCHVIISEELSLHKLVSYELAVNMVRSMSVFHKYAIKAMS